MCNQGCHPTGIAFEELTMPRPKKSEVEKFVGLTLEELAAEFKLLGVPEDAAPALAAAAYFYCPFPAVVHSAWQTVIDNLHTLAGHMAKLQNGREGPNPDYDPLFDRVRRLLVLPVGGLPHDTVTTRDGDGNVCSLGYDAPLYEIWPNRDGHIFLLIGVELIHQVGKMTMEATFKIIAKVLRLMDGSAIDPTSVERQYRRSKAFYFRTWPKRRIDLGLLQSVHLKPQPRYVPVWKEGRKIKAVPSLVEEPSVPPAVDMAAANASEDLTGYKDIPSWAGPKGPLAKWRETGKPPHPDELPFKLAPWTRAEMLQRYNNSRGLPAGTASGNRKPSTSIRAKSGRRRPR
jgi:hypothetical protein